MSLDTPRAQRNQPATYFRSLADYLADVALGIRYEPGAHVIDPATNTYLGVTDGLGVLQAVQMFGADGLPLGAYGDTTALKRARLAGRPATRGKRVVLWGGSETARGYRRKSLSAGQVVFNAATKTITVSGTTHKLHTGAHVFLASEAAQAPAFTGSPITVDNGFCYGVATVIDSQTFTVPFWSMIPASSPYAQLNGPSTLTWYLHCLDLATPPNKFNELQHWLGHPFTFVLSIATGSNNSAQMVDRLPALVSMAQAGLFDELRGTGGVGNTELWALNNSLSNTWLVNQVQSDITAVCSALAPYGIVTTLELPPAQLNSTGQTTAGQQLVNEMLRQLAADPALRLNLEDDYTYSIDPSSGLARTRYQLNGNDNVHPSNEGCVYYAREHADQEAVGGNHYPNVYRLVTSPLDSYKADATSVQLFDPLTSATPTVAPSTLPSPDGKASGLVPQVVRALASTGNAGRSWVLSYEQTGDFWHIYALLTAAAANDNFTILLGNPGGSRALETLLAGFPGGTFFAGCEFSFVPLTGSWTSIDTYFGATMSYGGGTISNLAGYLAADTLNDTANADGPMTQARMGPSFMPPFTLPPDLTAISAASAGIYVTATAAAAGTALLRITRPTCRKIN